MRYAKDTIAEATSELKRVNKELKETNKALEDFNKEGETFAKLQEKLQENGVLLSDPEDKN